jgi:hypothetical protein
MPVLVMGHIQPTYNNSDHNYLKLRPSTHDTVRRQFPTGKAATKFAYKLTFRPFKAIPTESSRVFSSEEQLFY